MSRSNQLSYLGSGTSLRTHLAPENPRGYLNERQAEAAPQLP